MKLRISEQARSDLRAIGDFIAEDDPRRALSFVDELEDRCRQLTEKPLIWPRVDRFPEVRRRLHKRYLILYRVVSDEVEVLHVVHGARNYASLLGDEDEREE